jgi:hypothetical protein
MGIHRQTHLSYGTDRIEKDAFNNSSLFRVFIAAGTCIPSRCLATIWGINMQTHRLTGGIYEVPH